jgi:hypothetical protein
MVHYRYVTQPGESLRRVSPEMEGGDHEGCKVLDLLYITALGDKRAPITCVQYVPVHASTLAHILRMWYNRG